MVSKDAVQSQQKNVRVMPCFYVRVRPIVTMFDWESRLRTGSFTNGSAHLWAGETTSFTVFMQVHTRKGFQLRTQMQARWH